MSREPKYRVLESFGKVEIRFYEPFLVAEVVTTGTRKEAIRAGFNLLADYLFGNNDASRKFSMSVPVTQRAKGDHWTIRFMLTEEAELKNLPKPNKSVVQLLQMPAQKFAVIRFSGFPSDEKIQRQTIKLQRFADSNNWAVIGSPIFAFYNAPWAIPFLRRNEVMLEINKDTP